MAASTARFLILQICRVHRCFYAIWTVRKALKVWMKSSGPIWSCRSNDLTTFVSNQCRDIYIHIYILTPWPITWPLAVHARARGNESQSASLFQYLCFVQEGRHPLLHVSSLSQWPVGPPFKISGYGSACTAVFFSSSRKPVLLSQLASTGSCLRASQLKNLETCVSISDVSLEQ